MAKGLLLKSKSHARQQNINSILENMKTNYEVQQDKLFARANLKGIIEDPEKLNRRAYTSLGTMMSG